MDNPSDAELQAALQAYRENIDDHGRAKAMLCALLAAAQVRAKTHVVARPGEEYHEDMGNVLWWRFPIDEPPYAGMPGDSDWPGYHTHFTPIPIPMLSASGGNRD